MRCPLVALAVVAPLIQHCQRSVTQLKPFSSIVRDKGVAQLLHIYDTLHALTYRM